MLILENNGVFILETQNTHYVMAVDKEGVLTHLHWGKKCEIADYKATYTGNNDSSNHSARDICKTEYIPYGGIVYRPPAFMATYPDGCRESLLTYKDFNVSEIEDGFMLEVILEDKPYNLDVTLCYKLRDNTDIIERFAKIKNNSDFYYDL